MRRYVLGAGVATMCALSMVSGCITISGDVAFWKKVKVDGEERIALAADDIRGLDIKTRNGQISVTASDGDEVIIQTTKRGTGASDEDAQDCLDAIETFVDDSGPTRQIGWRWRKSKRSGWSAQVSFDVACPKRMALSATTQNGEINVADVEGDCNVRTRNGRINIDVQSTVVSAVSHNGRVTVTAPSENLTARTHNGALSVSLTGAVPTAGNIRTHNGSVHVYLHEDGAANLVCKAHNGRISSQVALSDVTKTRRSLTGKFGTGASDPLTIRTHNGAITLE